MKKTWNTPELQDLTISATATTDMQGCWWIPSYPTKPGKPGQGGNGGKGQSPDQFHPNEPVIPDGPVESLS